MQKGGTQHIFIIHLNIARHLILFVSFPVFPLTDSSQSTLF